MSKGKFFTAKTVTGLAVLVALIVVLQVLSTFFPVRIGGVELSFVLVPIVLGAVMYGVLGGFVLGSAFTSILLNEHFFGTFLICVVKAVLAGVVPGLIFQLVKNKKTGVVVASASAPIVNTGIFILGCLLFVKDTLQANFTQGSSVVYFLFIGCAGINFIFEFLVSVLLAPVVYSVVKSVTHGKIN